jgi:hypothetical protein
VKKSKVVEGFQNVYCRFGVSKVLGAGVGVFAIRRIPKGINPFQDTIGTKWVKVKISDLADVHPNVMKMIDDFGVKEGNSIWVPKTGLNNLTICFHINHSKTPNMGTEDQGDSFFTLRIIEEGEELTVDYETYDEPGHALMGIA